VKVVSVVNGKGGVGKTTTTVNLAELLSEVGKVLAVDADPQGSTAWWLERSESNVDLVSETDSRLLGRLREVGGYDVVLVDTQPALRVEGLRAVIRASDYVILPSPPAAMDVREVIRSVLSEVRPSGVAHRVLLTRVDSRSMGEAREAREEFERNGIPTFRSVVREYKAHRVASLLGSAISQLGLRRGRNAEEDYRRVAAELASEAGLTPATTREEAG